MINELTKSFQDSVKERVSSPLLGSFILFFLTCNYKIVIVFFSSGTAQEKLDALPPFWPYEAFSIILAIILTSLFVVAYPWISNKIYEYWDKKRAERRVKQRARLSSEIKEMKPEEIANLKRQLLEDEYHFNEILSGKNNLIDSQKETIDSLKTKVAELEKIAGDIYPGFEFDEGLGLPFKKYRGGRIFFCPSCLQERKAIPLRKIHNSSNISCSVCLKQYESNTMMIY